MVGWFLFLRQGSYSVAQAGLELGVFLCQTPSEGIRGMDHHPWLHTVFHMSLLCVPLNICNTRKVSIKGRVGIQAISHFGSLFFICLFDTAIYKKMCTFCVLESKVKQNKKMLPTHPLGQANLGIGNQFLGELNSKPWVVVVVVVVVVAITTF